MSIQAQGADGAGTFDHEFKSHPDVFWPAARGEKTFEYRRDDRGGYEVGQTVRLRCFDPAIGYEDVAPLDRRITNILRGGEFELPQGYCILSLAPLASRSDSAEVTALEEAFAAAACCASCATPSDCYQGKPCRLETDAEAAAATPAPATPPGVPDSLREDGWRIVRAVMRRLSAAKNAGGIEDPETSAQVLGAAVDAGITMCREALATHPAGQSAGTEAGWVIANALDGPEQRFRRWGQIGPEWTADRTAALWFARRSDAEAFAAEDEDAWRVLPVTTLASHSAGQSTGQGAETKIPADREAVIALAVHLARDGDTSLIEKIKAELSAPDSTRTGDEGTERLREAVSKALHDNQFLDDWNELVDPVVDAVLAACPAAPEAQGAWRPISTAPKDGSEVLVFVPAEREQFVAFWHSNGFWQYAYVEPTHTTLVCRPTDWQPLPAPPASSGQGGR